ncbi:hypothetical protein [Myceligenerans crystallogenes]|uniref:Uncharacterized protein n=1 Tax=Myceligenerans crystallogenes TaxID=316335 RepID=A0ABN2N9S3_9MICO
MNWNLVRNVMVLVSIAYGVTTGLLWSIDSPAALVFTMVGAGVVAIGWVAVGSFGQQDGNGPRGQH